MGDGLLRASLAVSLVAALAGCGAGDERQGGHQPPRDGVAGLQLTGSFAGRQVALSDGAPSLLAGGACQERLGASAELCFRSRDIDGTEVTVSFLNPGVVQPGATVPVGRGDCRTAQECAEVTDVAVLDVQVGQQRQRAEAGELRLRQVIPGRRYAGSMTLSFRRGDLGGTFDVVPRPET